MEEDGGKAEETHDMDQWEEDCANCILRIGRDQRMRY